MNSISYFYTFETVSSMNWTVFDFFKHFNTDLTCQRCQSGLKTGRVVFPGLKTGGVVGPKSSIEEKAVRRTGLRVTCSEFYNYLIFINLHISEKS